MTRKEQGDRTREALLDAAVSEFVLRGFQASREHDILVRAGYKKGALHHHFATKRALAETILLEKSRVWPVLMDEIGRRQLRGLDVVRRLARLLAARPRFLAAMKIGAELNGGQPDSAPFARWQDANILLLQQAIEDHEVPDWIDTRVTANILAGCAWGVIISTHGSRDVSAVNNELDLTLSLLFRGVATGATQQFDPSRTG